MDACPIHRHARHGDQAIGIGNHVPLGKHRRTRDGLDGPVIRSARRHGKVLEPAGGDIDRLRAAIRGPQIDAPLAARIHRRRAAGEGVPGGAPFEIQVVVGRYAVGRGHGAAAGGIAQRGHTLVTADLPVVEAAADHGTHARPVYAAHMIDVARGRTERAAALVQRLIERLGLRLPVDHRILCAMVQSEQGGIRTALHKS